eukprot:TRINITY_DN2030_c0_g1_i4.p1 TRINITY_DN2030_c0_g1~~TRINITY_DN2030_c0_g1_i4.p1  ORF type:complete len:235 (-),score=70.74 TRINITY_DN2030_c0_g1_i4:223-927(-)
MQRGLVGSEMCIRDRYQRRVHGIQIMAEEAKKEEKKLEEIKAPEESKVPLMDTAAEGKSIPKTIFIENVEEFVAKHGYVPIVQQMNELYQKYKYLDTSLNRKKLTMKSKIPDIKKALEIVAFLKEKSAEKKPIETKYALTENAWANATVKNDSGMVCLWLGADTMVEFPYDEATELLQKNLSNAEKYLESVEGDLSFLKDQITTTEVNMARVYNENVRQKQLKTIPSTIQSRFT